MKKMFNLLLVISALMAFSGCAKKMHSYSISSENVLVLKGLLGKSADIGIGKFTDSGKNQNATTCRMATPMETPSGETFATYIKNALRKELIISEMFSHEPELTLTGNLNSIEGSTALGDAFWDFDLTMKSSNGKEFTVHSRHSYSSSFSASAACYKMQASFPVAVRKLVSEMILDPQFVTLLKKKATE